MEHLNEYLAWLNYLISGELQRPIRTGCVSRWHNQLATERGVIRRALGLPERS